MIVAHYAIVALVGLSPLLLFFDSALLDGIIELYAAVALVLVAVSIHPGEARHWIRTVHRAVALAALPLLWMLIQTLPIPGTGISRSIWQSAMTALGTPLSAHITVDPGFTLLAFCRYAALITIGVAAAAVAIERQPAERLFLALGGAAAGMSLIALVLYLGGSGISTTTGADRIRSASTAGGIEGVVLFTAIIIMVVERHLTRRNSQNFRWQFLLPLAGATGGLVICALAVLASAAGQAIFAAACGIVAVGIVQFVRRIGLGRRAALAMAAMAIAGAAAIALTKAEPAPSALWSRYAVHAPAERVAVADRMVNEVGLLGSGAGTFGAIYRLYAVQQKSAPPPTALTSATQIAIEFGRPALWVIVALTVALILLCARGGFDRGRDFFYSTAGAGMAVASLIWAFCDTGLDNIAISILLSVTLGLTLAQSVSRTLDSLLAVRR